MNEREREKGTYLNRFIDTNEEPGAIAEVDQQRAEALDKMRRSPCVFIAMADPDEPSVFVSMINKAQPPITLNVLYHAQEDAHAMIHDVLRFLNDGTQPDVG